MLTQPGQRFTRTYFYIIKQLSETVILQQKNITILYNQVKNLNQHIEKQHEDQELRHDVLHRCLPHTMSFFQLVPSKECINPTIHSIEQHATMTQCTSYEKHYGTLIKALTPYLWKYWSLLRKLRQVRLKKNKKQESTQKLK